MTWLPPGPAWLFCPADRPERYDKASRAADVVILDLEDAVTSAAKSAARQMLIDHPQDPERTVIRVNPASGPEHLLDLQALRRTGYRRIMLPKCESPQQLSRLAEYEVVILIESALGAITVTESVQAAPVIGVMWGAEDLIVSLGGTSSRGVGGSYRDVAQNVRSASLLAAKAFGHFALDSVVLDIADLETLAAESEDAVASGFDGKVAIHPRQVETIRQQFAPTDAQLGWARRVLASAATERGVFTFEGAMIDAPILRQAESVLRRASK
ncbi:CoA ester lyase [Nakamurella antarctica]|uniref:CoA ester lyase n=1 Tax=Nakamurella antarctica TaxID=1902245 RepID=A0A3G8ZKW1_9ACTN|nr:CoA ester lyase [Nakamurella antarctica]AZI57883.1 CoA ester lyase [Nakamurella antarctica]